MSTKGKVGGTGVRSKRMPLLAVNGALLVALAAVTFMPEAQAQPRPRGSYTMVAGRTNGATGGVVYIVDTRNDELVAVTWDPNTKALTGIGYRNIAADAASLVRGGNR